MTLLRRTPVTVAVAVSCFAFSCTPVAAQPAEQAPTASALLQELPFRLGTDGIAAVDQLTRPIDRERLPSSIVVKVPLADFSIRLARSPGFVGISDMNAVVGLRGSSHEILAAIPQGLTMGGVCLYDNPDLPELGVGIAELDFTGEDAGDGTAIVPLSAPILETYWSDRDFRLLAQLDGTWSARFRAGRAGRQVLAVGITRVRCISAKTRRSERLDRVASTFRIRSAPASSATVDTFARQRELETEYYRARATFIASVIDSSPFFAAAIAQDEADSFSGRRRVEAIVTVDPRAVEWGTFWQASCEILVGESVAWLRIDGPEDQTFRISGDFPLAGARGEPRITCGLLQRSAWDPRSVSTP